MDEKIVRIGQSAFLKKVWKILLTFVEQGCILTKVAEHGNNKSTKHWWVLRAFVERAKTKSKKLKKVVDKESNTWYYNKAVANEW